MTWGALRLHSASPLPLQPQSEFPLASTQCTQPQPQGTPLQPQSGSLQPQSELLQPQSIPPQPQGGVLQGTETHKITQNTEATKYRVYGRRKFILTIMGGGSEQQSWREGLRPNGDYTQHPRKAQTP